MAGSEAPVPAVPTGLRERNKARTRARIRDAALRLFHERGYEATTVQQVAESAEVSLSTLFRYFPTKSRLVLSFDLAALIRAAFLELRPEESVFDAINTALRASFEQLSPGGDLDGMEAEPASARFTRARDALLGEATGMVGVLAELIGERWGRDPHDVLVQAAAGGVVGIGVAAWTADRDLGRAAALEILDVGLQGLQAGLRPRPPDRAGQ